MPRRLFFSLVCAVALATGAHAQSPSPFSPASKAAPTAASPDADYELTGVIGGSKTSLVNITRLRDKRTYWLKPGESAGGLVLESFDPETNQAVIRAEGRSRTLLLKSPARVPQGTAGVAMAPAAPLAMATVAPRVPVTDEEKATEARMLVSDLLEIGMMQRQAYENAQKQAAAQPASASAPPAKP